MIIFPGYPVISNMPANRIRIYFWNVPMLQYSYALLDIKFLKKLVYHAIVSR